MTQEEFYKKNEFVKRILNDNKKLALRDISKELIGRNHLTEKEKFIIDTFQVFHRITSKMEKINGCIALINSFPKTKLWEKSFLRSEYIRYHLEVYYGNIIGIFDRCLHLVNHLYDLGLKSKDVKYEIIISNNHIEHKNVAKILKIFHKSIQGIRAVRNFIAHQGELTDKELDEIERYEFILSKSKNIEKKLSMALKLKIKLDLSTYLRKKKKEIKTNNESIISVLNTFMLSILDQYKDKVTKIKN